MIKNRRTFLGGLLGLIPISFVGAQPKEDNTANISLVDAKPKEDKTVHLKLEWEPIGNYRPCDTYWLVMDNIKYALVCGPRGVTNPIGYSSRNYYEGPTRSECLMEFPNTEGVIERVIKY